MELLKSNIAITGSLIQISQPYLSSVQETQHILKAVKAATADHEPQTAAISSVAYTWASANLTEDHISLLLEVLPPDIEQFSLSTLHHIADGSLLITCQNIASIFSKYKHTIRKFNSSYDMSKANWSLSFQKQIKSQTKNYRDCLLKWNNQVNKTLSKTHFLDSLPSTLTHLCLRGVHIGSITSQNPFETILEKCPNLRDLDLSKTKITDANILATSPSLLHRLAVTVTHLNLSCNRIHDESLSAIFAHQQSEAYENVAGIAIEETNISSSAYRILYRLMPNLEFFSQGYAEINDDEGQQIALAFSSQGKMEPKNQNQVEVKCNVWPKLLELQLDQIVVSSEVLASMLGHCPNLQKFSIFGAHIAGSITFPPLGKLKCLNICNVKNANNSTLQKIGESTSCLEVLKISGTSVTQRGLNFICKSFAFSHLYWIQISYLNYLFQYEHSEQKQGNIEVEKQESQPSAMELLGWVMRGLAELRYVEAYGMLEAAEVKKLRAAEAVNKNVEDRLIYGVLDAIGGIELSVQN